MNAAWTRRAVGVLGIITAGTPTIARGQAETTLSPVVGPRPRNVAARLVVDSSIAASSRPDMYPAARGAHDNGCAVVLRDPRHGTRYLLQESRRVKDSQTSRTGTTTIIRTRAEANYFLLPADVRTGEVQVQAQPGLRVDCMTQRVLGAVRIRPAGT